MAEHVHQSASFNYVLPGLCLAALVPAGLDAGCQGQTGHVVSCSIMLALLLLMLQSV